MSASLRRLPVLATLLITAAPPAVGRPPERGPMPHRVDLYGDPLPDGAVARLGSVRLRHAGLADFAFLPDGKTVLTVGTDQMVRWWDLGTGRQTRATQLPREPRFRRLAVSPDGSTVAIHDSFKITVWDTATGRTVRTLKSRDEVIECLTFRPDGSELAIGAAKSRVTFVSLKSGAVREKELGERYKNVPELRVGFSRNGRRMAVANADAAPGVQVVEAADFRSVFSRTGKFAAEALSADGARFATAEVKDDGNWEAGVVVRLFDLGSGKESVRYTLDVWCDDSATLAFTPDGKGLVCLGSNRGYVVDAATGRTRYRLPGGLCWPCFSPDGRTLAARAGPRLQLWDLRTGRELHDRPGPSRYGARAATADGRRIALSHAGTPVIGLWDAADGRLIRELPSPAGICTRIELAFSPDARTLTASNDLGNVRTWSVATGSERPPVELRDKSKLRGYIANYGLSPDGRRIAAITKPTDDEPGPSELCIWDTGTGQLLHRHLIRELTRFDCRWLPDGSAIEVAGPNGLIFRDAEMGRIGVEIGHPRPGCFSADGRLRTEEGFDEIDVREVATGRLVASIPVGKPPHAPGGLAAGWRALVHAEGRLLRVLDLATGQERGRWALPDLNPDSPRVSPVNELLVLPGDRRALTTLDDGTALVWDLSAFPPPRLSDKYGEPELRLWWDDLAGNHPRRAYSAGWRLSEAPADEVVRFFRDRLKPARVPDGLEKWLADLASPTFATREVASRRLVELGPVVVPTLEKALKATDSAEVRDRLEKLVDKLSNPVPPPAILRAVRAVAVLERVGTAEARRLLEDLARGSVDSPQTRAAKAALVRMAGRP